MASRRKRSRACGVPGQVVGKEFQGDKAAEAGVFGLVDHAHASAAEFFEDAVVGDCLLEQGVPLQDDRARLRLEAKMRGGDQWSAG